MACHTVVRGLSSLVLFSLAGFAQAGGKLESPADHAISEHVRQQLAEHADLGWSLTVQTRNSIVYIGGNASTSLAKADAEDVARQVPGVTKVVDTASSDCG